MNDSSRREKRIINIIFFPFPCVIITKIGFLASDNGVLKTIIIPRRERGEKKGRSKRDECSARL